MASKQKKKFITKNYLYKYWVMRLTNLAVNMFKYPGLPDEINEAQMEKEIMLGAFGIFFYDEALGKYFCLPGAITGLDVYGYPTRAKPIGKTTEIIFPEYNVHKDCVLIYANRTRTSALEYINEYADKLSDIDLAIKMNTRAMKHPLMMKTTEQKKNSVETLMRQYDDDYFVIFPDNDLFSESSLQTIDFNVSASEILNLQKQKETVVNEFFNIFGISGSVEKRERMISGEMNAMMQQVAINREMWMSTRQEAIDEINKMFNLNMKVETPQYLSEVQQDNIEEKEDNNE